MALIDEIIALHQAQAKNNPRKPPLTSMGAPSRINPGNPMQSNLFVNSLLDRYKTESAASKAARSIGVSQARTAAAAVPGSPSSFDSAGAIASILRGTGPSTSGLANTPPSLLETLLSFETAKRGQASQETVAREGRISDKEVANIRNRGALAEQILLNQLYSSPGEGEEGGLAGGVDMSALRNLIYVLENNPGMQGLIGPPRPTSSQKKKKKKSPAEIAEEYANQ